MSAWHLGSGDAVDTAWSFISLDECLRGFHRENVVSAV